MLNTRHTTTSRTVPEGLTGTGLQRPLKHWLTSHQTSLAVALLVGAFYFASNYALLHHGHFHEDAYILFIYVENVLNGFGVSFYPGGPPAEGATDFLWMWLLVLLAWLGMDVGTAAIALNAIGVTLIVFILANEWVRAKIDYLPLRILLAPFIVIWLFGINYIAAAGGFSVFLYMALVLLVYVAVRETRYLVITPYIAITIALFRPDGVIIGVGFTLLGLYRAHSLNCLRPYLRACSIAFIIGVVYFISRYAYFGNLLPLPLYVKSSTSGLAGLEDNLGWLRKHRIYIYPLLVLFLIYPRLALRKLLLAMPVFVFFAILSVATQSQNIGYRFQAPLFIIIYFIAFLLALEAASRPKYLKLKAAIAALALPVFFSEAYKNHMHAASTITASNYINSFPVALKEILPKGITIALTEAGRLPFWNQTGNQLIDTNGLNTPWAAMNSVTKSYIEQLSPDVIMYHNLTPPILPATESMPATRVISLKNGLAPQQIDNWAGEDRKVNESVAALTGYLQEYAGDYDIFLVDYMEDDTYLHIYAIKKQLGLKPQMLEALEASFNTSTQRSYYAMRRQQKLHR